MFGSRYQQYLSVERHICCFKSIFRLWGDCATFASMQKNKYHVTVLFSLALTKFFCLLILCIPIHLWICPGCSIFEACFSFSNISVPFLDFVQVLKWPNRMWLYTLTISRGHLGNQTKLSCGTMIVSIPSLIKVVGVFFLY